GADRGDAARLGLRRRSAKVHAALPDRAGKRSRPIQTRLHHADRYARHGLWRALRRTRQRWRDRVQTGCLELANRVLPPGPNDRAHGERAWTKPRKLPSQEALSVSGVWSCSSSRGPNATRSTAPPPGTFAACAKPPCASAAWRTIASPSPEPGFARASFARWKRSKTKGRSCSLNPGPWSRTDSVPSRSSTSIKPPGGLHL